VAAADVARLSRRSGFVFAGEIERTNASTVALVRPTKEIAVVRVREVLKAPADFGERKGERVTVRLGAPARKGQRAVFFTVGWVSGDGLAVQEIGRQPATDVGTMRGQMDETEERDELAALRKRVGAAEAVIVGKVAGTQPFGGKEEPPSSEHDPRWRTAVVVVERTEKGRPKEGERLGLAYASSDDVMWFRAPKPVQGERAVFLAHRRRLEERDETALAIVEPLDMLPVAELDRIRSVMRRT
jgi:hypothetical protein